MTGPLQLKSPEGVMAGHPSVGAFGWIPLAVSTPPLSVQVVDVRPTHAVGSPRVKSHTS